MNPLFGAWLQETKARARRLSHWVGSPTRLCLLIALLGVLGVIAVVLTARSSFARQSLEWMAQHRLVAAIAAGMYTLVLVRRQRSQLTLEYARSWLRAAPMSARSFAAMTAMRVMLKMFVHAAAVSGLLACISVVADQPLASSLLPVLLGVLIGSLVGALLPPSSVTPASDNSRFIFRVRRAVQAPSLDGLSRWPIAHALAWHRPENARFLFIAAALSVPVGSSALLGLAILATWSLASYLIALVRAIPDVAKQAALWLRPTCVPFGAFAWAITRRVLVHQLVGVALLGGVAIAAGGTISSVMYFCSMWLAIASMIAMINVRQHFFSLPSLVRTVIAVVLVLAAESRVRGWGAALAIYVTVVHLRGPTRVRT